MKTEEKSLRVAIVDRFPYSNWYSCSLGRALSRTLKGKGVVFLYAPKNSAPKRAGYCIYRGVWSPHLYPIQIIKQAIHDKVKVIHIQFEFVTFGSFHTSILTLPLIALLRLLKVKVVVTLHGPIFPKNSSEEIINSLRPALVKIPISLAVFCIILFYRLISVLSSKIIVHAKVFQKWLSDYGIDNCAVIPHGVELINPMNSYYRKEELLNQSNEVILFFGVLTPRKGLETLLQAFSIVMKQINNVTLMIAGDEPSYYRGYKDKLIKMAEELKINDRTVFLGKVPDDLVPDLFKMASIIVLPYLFSISASGPMSLAVAYGKPIIASKTEFFEEMLVARCSSLLFPPKDYKLLARKIIEILSNREYAKQISREIRNMAVKFSWERIALLTLKLYERLSREDT